MDRPDSLPPAALWRRVAAGLYDLLLVLALFMVLTGLVILARTGRAIDSGSVWFQLLLLAAWWLYFGWSWTHGGQTIGMRAWRLELRCEDAGAGVSWRQATVRFLGAGLSLIVAGLGFVWSLWDRDRLTWHDRLSHTSLRHHRQSAQSDDGEHRNNE
jgi:uncharacterized RDD family membrane protein YckC